MFLFRHLQVTQATNQIVMNCADIDIITASFVPPGGEGKSLLCNQSKCRVVFFLKAPGVQDAVASDGGNAKDVHPPPPLLLLTSHLSFASCADSTS